MVADADWIIDDSTNNDLLFHPSLARGGEPRDFAAYPMEMFAPPSEMPLIPRSEWSDRCKLQVETKSRLSDVRNRANGGKPIPSLNQNPQGFCWAYSTTGTIIIQRAVANQPYVRLSAHAVACKVMNFQDKGGWAGLSAKFIRENGIPSVDFWKERSMSKANDTPETWANASLHKITEDWVDLASPVYSQKLTFDQVASCLLTGIPCAVDMDWWGHSIAALDLVEVEPGDFGIRIWNSWGDEWGENGTAVLRGARAIPSGAIATRVTTPSVS